MSQQALDLRRSMQIVRRHKLLVGIVVALGIVGGAILTPWSTRQCSRVPRLISDPGSAKCAARQTNSNTSGTGLPVYSNPTGCRRQLSGAPEKHYPDIRPAMSLELRFARDVRIGILSTDILSVTAKGKNAAEAETTATAVADGYICLCRLSKKRGRVYRKRTSPPRLAPQRARRRSSG